MDPQIDGLIGYRLGYKRAVVFGGPVCATDDWPKLCRSFQDFCEKMGYKIIYAIVSHEFKTWALGTICHASIEFGQRLVLNPRQNPFENTGIKGSLVRRKCRHAEKEGVKAYEYIPFDPSIESGIQDVAAKWLKSRDRPQIHISNAYLFNDCLGKRWFYAKQNEEIVGVLVLNRLESSKGWLMNHLMVVPEAAHGTHELLVIHAIEELGKEECQFLSFGSTTSNSLGEIQGLHPFSRWTTRAIFNISNRVFHLEGLKTFWGKFQPVEEKTYILFDHSLGWRSVMCLMNAFNVSIRG